ncbi:PEP/pyruvate-binding domain-containing protein [Cellulomonas sp. NPDC057328]|uniref:PEP/pyruvate-binding domain-containing protein n=1 Tax=Cellulomonas sp. NPDC057328 TaxID=3346101 RepID=UPI003633E596
MLVPLADAVRATCGGKAAALGALTRAGLPVPDGFVVPVGTGRHDDHGVDHSADDVPPRLRDALARALEALGGTVAVRSSAADEDAVGASAAGQYATVLAVRGVDEVVDAVRTCWASLHSARAVAYRAATGAGAGARPLMGVLVQRQLDAEVSGVMFTPDGRGTTRVEASWGLGTGVVGGTVTPDAYDVGPTGTVTRTLGDKRTRTDRHGGRLVTRDVPAPDRSRPTLDDAAVARLAALGGRAAAVLGGAQDVEWAVVDGTTWLLQARPVTAELPRPASARAATGADGASSAADASSGSEATSAVLVGTPGSAGSATGPARVVRGPSDVARVRPGDVLVCPWTDPGWTPLLRVAAAVVTETGGVLSHAAIVARERGIPAVLGVPCATTTLRDGALVTVDGTAGTVTAAVVTGP